MAAPVPRLDTHQHLWSLDRIERGDYPWMPDDGPLREEYLPGRLRPELERTGVGATIVVQAAPSVQETRYLLELARDTDFLVGVTGWAALDDRGAPDVLAGLAADPLLLAIRPMIQDLPDPEWITTPTVRTALRAMAELGLRFEALTLPHQLPAAYRALAEVPELPVVINHLSKPGYDWGTDGDWREWLARFARRPGTVCKLSGMVTEVGPQWTPSRFVPYTEFVFEEFGPDRVLFGSDWPVCRLAAEYADVVKLAGTLLHRIGLTETDGFWHGNGERFYGVSLPG
ncbi:amidohydrolase family protein [Amycolatopsis suaedae]|uniref:Amidohydrolase n=1 Tax=Amycolatopsis suaedae TaxID=2510978 RepID=A0A4Q7J8C1_9PSEU|nr:amidohydrolase family protein [Amycolatopsis suaedae]RZQ63082.1 amidohydrolase [Amycolatopsis suaedae]